MGFKNLRLFPIDSTKTGTGGYPFYDSPIRLQGSVAVGDPAAHPEDFNAVKVTITPTIKTRALNADNKEKLDVKFVGYELALEIFRVEPLAVAPLFGYTKDANGDIKEIINATRKQFGVYFEGETADGLKYQKYLYKVEFTDPDFETETDTGESVTTLKLAGNGYAIKESASGEHVKAYTVYATSSNWKTTIPTEMLQSPTPAE